MGVWIKILFPIVALVACAGGTGRASSKLTSKESPATGTRKAGLPCTQDGECESGACLTLGGQSQCAASCADGVACDGDLVCQKANPRDAASPTVCGERASHECSSCNTDSDCGGYGRACLEVAEGKVCGIDCTISAANCPLGFECISVLGADGEALSAQCLPQPGVCFCAPGEKDKCTPWSAPVVVVNPDGSVTVTTTHPSPNPSNSHGGVMQPTPGCKPTVETCNGKDDDCDGLIDEGTDGKPLRVACGTGTCGGHQACVNGALGACDAQVPVAETCNGKDDNCDGVIDEGLVNSVDSCGTCGNVCPGAGQEATLIRACQSYGQDFACAPVQCVGDNYDADNAEANGCEAQDDPARATSDAALPGDKTIVDDNNDFVTFTGHFGADGRQHSAEPYDRSAAAWGAAFSTDWYKVLVTDDVGGDMELRARLDVTALPSTSVFEVCVSPSQGNTFDVEYGACGSQPAGQTSWCTGMCCCAQGGSVAKIPLGNGNTDPWGDNAGYFYARVSWKSGTFVPGQSMNPYELRLCDDGQLQTCPVVGSDCGKPHNCVD